jgi:hypothetical protein
MWEHNPIGDGPIAKLSRRIMQRLAGTRGVFVSMSGYTAGAVSSMLRGQQPDILLLDRVHLEAMLSGMLSRWPCSPNWCTELSALPHAELAVRLAEAYGLIGRQARVEQLEQQADSGLAWQRAWMPGGIGPGAALHRAGWAAWARRKRSASRAWRRYQSWAPAAHLPSWTAPSSRRTLTETEPTAGPTCHLSHRRPD